jgi:hypothetical protein
MEKQSLGILYLLLSVILLLIKILVALFATNIVSVKMAGLFAFASHSERFGHRNKHIEGSLVKIRT